MFRLFSKNKKRLTRHDFVKIMIELQQQMVEVLSRSVQNHFKPDFDDKTLRLECEVLSLWILSLAIPDNALKIDIHNEYCRSRDFDDDLIKNFFGYLDKRYRKYYEAYNIWVKDHQAGSMLGSVVLSVFKGEDDSNKLQLDVFATLEAFTLVIETFKSTIESIGDLKKKFDLSEVSKVF